MDSVYTTVDTVFATTLSQNLFALPEKEVSPGREGSRSCQTLASAWDSASLKSNWASALSSALHARSNSLNKASCYTSTARKYWLPVMRPRGWCRACRMVMI